MRYVLMLLAITGCGDDEGGTDAVDVASETDAPEVVRTCEDYVIHFCDRVTRCYEFTPTESWYFQPEGYPQLEVSNCKTQLLAGWHIPACPQYPDEATAEDTCPNGELRLPSPFECRNVEWSRWAKFLDENTPCPWGLDPNADEYYLSALWEAMH